MPLSSPADNLIAFPSPPSLELLGIRTHAQLNQYRDEQPALEYIVEDLIPARSIVLAVGVSGAGKTPLKYQICRDVSLGVPFLGRATTQGRTLYFDFESPLKSGEFLMANLAVHAGISHLPADMKMWSRSSCPENFCDTATEIFDLIRLYRPTLAVIDTMGYLFSKAEGGSEEAYAMYKQLRALKEEVGCSIVLVHHLKKEGTDSKGRSTHKPLESTGVIDWMSQARGSSSLVNGADVRLGIDRSSTIMMPSGEPAVIIKANERTYGDTAAIYLDREMGEHGKPIGYKRLIVRAKNARVHAFYERLPDEFRYTDAFAIWGKNSASSLMLCLNSLIADALVVRNDKLYKKVRFVE